tara:strand:- start:289 stop:609 length:321 start_codon:yes stop_codon:yes gene_type:complete
MTDLKIVTIGPETIAALAIGPGLPISHAEMCITYPAGDIVACDVFDHYDNILIGDGDDAYSWVEPGSAANAIASQIAFVAQLVIGGGDKYRITAPETIADGNYELP